MPDYTAQELDEALRAINSIIHKCEKAQEKFPEGNAHHTLLRNRLEAMYISKVLITAELAKKNQRPSADDDENSSHLLSNLELLHTTDLGADRIKRNLHLNVDHVVGWCKETIQRPDSRITRKGKNWYILASGCEITVNAHSYTIITAHKVTVKR